MSSEAGVSSMSESNTTTPSMNSQLTLPGYCPICERDSVFEMKRPGQYRSLCCGMCGSGSRHRALWFALNRAFPNWRDLNVHEGSPGWDIVSQKLAKECRHYTASQFDPALSAGQIVNKTPLPCGRYVIQNLEQQTFPSETFDLVITQDVFEHLFDPLTAISEIARTLKQGGATIMTVPVVLKFFPSRRRARLVDGQVQHLLPPEYHGSPVSNDGSLVTIDWGFDIASHLSTASNMQFVMQTFENVDFGIRDECNQILIGRKESLPSLD